MYICVYSIRLPGQKCQTTLFVTFVRITVAGVSRVNARTRITMDMSRRCARAVSIYSQYSTYTISCIYIYSEIVEIDFSR